MSSANSPQAQLAQLVEYQKAEMMRQQMIFMQQINMGVAGGLLGAPAMQLGESDGRSYTAALAAAAAAMSATGGGYAKFGAGPSGLGILGGIEQTAPSALALASSSLASSSLASLASASLASASASASASAVGMPVGMPLRAEPQSLHPPGSELSQVRCT